MSSLYAWYNFHLWIKNCRTDGSIMQITQEKKEQTQRGKGALFAKEKHFHHIDLQRNDYHTHPTCEKTMGFVVLSEKP